MNITTSFGQESPHRHDYISFDVEVVVGHSFGVQRGGCVFICVSSIINLHQMSSMPYSNNFICFSVYYKQLALELHDFLLVVEVLFHHTAETSGYGLCHCADGVKW